MLFLGDYLYGLGASIEDVERILMCGIISYSKKAYDQGVGMALRLAVSLRTPHFYPCALASCSSLS